MGSTSTLLLLDIDDVGTRVLPAVRAWVADGRLADWWAEALTRAGRLHEPDPADRAVWPAMRGQPGAATVPDAGCLVPLPDRRLGEATRSAVEVAVITATVGDGLAFGNTRSFSLDLIDEYDPVLDPVPGSGSWLAALFHELETGLLHVNVGSGGYAEGLLGSLDAAEVAELDDELAAHGSHPVTGSASDIRAAMEAVPTEPVNLHRPGLTLMALHSMARLARNHDLGLLHGRDMTTDHVGSWQAGVLRRH